MGSASSLNSADDPQCQTPKSQCNGNDSSIVTKSGPNDDGIGNSKQEMMDKPGVQTEREAGSR